MFVITSASFSTSSINSYRFSSSQQGSVFCKVHPRGEETCYNVLSLNVPSHQPPTLAMPGLSQKRREYLFRSIRPFADEEFRDITCPNPSTPAPVSDLCEAGPLPPLPFHLKMVLPLPLMLWFILLKPSESIQEKKL